MAALETSTRPPRRADPTKFFFIMPAVIWVLLFTIFPLLYALYTSFFSFRFGRINQFVGFANYVRLFTDSNLHNGLRVTLTFVIVTVTVQMLLGFALALLLNREMRGKSSPGLSVSWRVCLIPRSQPDVGPGISVRE